MNATQEILSNFQEIYNTKKEIQLINVYQGVPITYPATILEIGSDFIRVETEIYQLVCLYRERETYIQSGYLPRIVQARVIEMDIPNLHAALAEFRYVRNRIGDRRQVRVWPRTPIESGVRLAEKDEPIRGELADLSQDGLGLYFPRHGFPIHAMRPGEEIKVILHLPGDYEIIQRKLGDEDLDPPPDRYSRENIRYYHLPALTNPLSSKYGYEGQRYRYPEIEAQGFIVNVREEPIANRFRVGIRLLPKDSSRAIIAQFISRRQYEIMRELKELSDLL